ncbi:MULTISPECIES: ATP-binding protein [unclassified Caballeronia]|uniref:PAS domain-containing hybrid sensor histidine kinase/response regulator n=1 Tax=unclassified Caballeronia TaxID=2646786 RepID=UPI0020291E63|nr:MULTISPECIES: ATP-binding protein [unclassified Caballeronia]
MLDPHLFQIVFNSLPSGNYLLSPTPEAKILAVNDAFLQASSRTREELVGMSLFDAFPGDPDDGEDTGELALRQSLARVLESGKSDQLPAQRYPIRIEDSGGHVAYEERFWAATNTPIFDGTGRIACVLHTTTDITKQYVFQSAQMESEKRFRALSNATEEVIYRINPDWTQLNQLEGRGFLKDVFETDPNWLDNFIPPDDQEMLQAAVNEAIRTRTVYHLEHRVRRASGGVGWVISRAVPMLNEAGEIYEWIGAASDITARKEAEHALKEADRRKDEFLAMLAHELRNPLAPITTAITLMEREDHKCQLELVGMVRRQVDHLTRLVDDLLDVSRITHGRIKLRLTPLIVGSAVYGAVETVASMTSARKQNVTVQLPPDPIWICVDAARLSQILVNVLNNACKYTQEGGRVEIAVSNSSAVAFIKISDNGSGISPALLPYIFDLFSQGERTLDRSEGGLGIGLSLVKRLVHLHKGGITVESPGPGQGTTVTISFPLLQHTGADITQTSTHSVKSIVPARSGRVLIVDDNHDAADSLGLLCEAEQHDVTVVYDSHSAIQAAELRQFDAALLDIGLPDMDGYQLAGQIRKKGEVKPVLIAVTGYGQEEDRLRTTAAGFDHHLVKPVDIDRLLKLLDAARLK